MNCGGKASTSSKLSLNVDCHQCSSRPLNETYHWELFTVDVNGDSVPLQLDSSLLKSGMVSFKDILFTFVCFNSCSYCNILCFRC